MPDLFATSPPPDFYFEGSSTFVAKHNWTLELGDWSFGVLELDVPTLEESDKFPARTTVTLGPPQCNFETDFSAGVILTIFAAASVILVAGLSVIITKFDRSRQSPAK